LFIEKIANKITRTKVKHALIENNLISENENNLKKLFINLKNDFINNKIEKDNFLIQLDNIINVI
jgi:hypothetical protein